MIEAIVPVSVVLIALIGAKKRDDDCYLSKEQGSILKGVAAVLLVLWINSNHHPFFLHL